MDRTDILNVLMDNCRISEAANDSESTTMIRLKENIRGGGGIEAGSARQQQYAGSREDL
jgi:hypothetical protein